MIRPASAMPAPFAPERLIRDRAIWPNTIPATGPTKHTNTPTSDATSDTIANGSVASGPIDGGCAVDEPHEGGGLHCGGAAYAGGAPQAGDGPPGGGVDGGGVDCGGGSFGGSPIAVQTTAA